MFSFSFIFLFCVFLLAARVLEQTITLVPLTDTKIEHNKFIGFRGCT